MAPSPGGLSGGHYSRKWGSGPGTKCSKTAKVKTNGSNVRRRETRKASQVSSIKELEEGDLLEGLQVIREKSFKSGAPESGAAPRAVP